MYAVFIGGCLGHFCCTLAAIIFGAAIAKKVSMTIRKCRCKIADRLGSIYFPYFNWKFSESLWWSSFPWLFSLYILSCCYWWKWLKLPNLYQIFIQENAWIFFLICEKQTGFLPHGCRDHSLFYCKHILFKQ